MGVAISLTSVFAKAYPTTVGTKTAYKKETKAVRGVQRKYLHRSLFKSVSPRSAHFCFLSIRVTRLSKSVLSVDRSRKIESERTVVFLVGGIEAERYTMVSSTIL